MSVIALAIALGGTVALFRLEADPAWRLLTFFPFLLAASGALQGLLRTCPMHSRHGTRECRGGPSLPMSDERSRQAARQLGWRVFWGSLGLAAFSTAVVYFLPA
jgi:hypothetical protein